MKKIFCILILLFLTTILFSQDAGKILSLEKQNLIKQGKHGYLQIIFTEPYTVAMTTSDFHYYGDMRTGKLWPNKWSLLLYVNNEVYIDNAIFPSGSQYIIPVPVGEFSVKYKLKNAKFITGKSKWGGLTDGKPGSWNGEASEKELKVTVKESEVSELRIIIDKDYSWGLQMVFAAGTGANGGFACCILPFPNTVYDVNLDLVQDKDKLAVITSDKNKLNINKEEYTEELLFVKVDSEFAGDYKNGWPQFIYAKDGKRTIEVRHSRPWELKKSSDWKNFKDNIFYGRMEIEEMIEKSNPHINYLLTFDVEKGKKYLFSVKSDENNPEDSVITITDEINGKSVPFESVKIAVITSDKNKININKEEYTEELLFVKVDSEVVGNYKDGWPQFVYTKNGKKTIEVRHSRPWTIKSSKSKEFKDFVLYGDMKIKETIEKSNSHINYQLTFDVEEGKKYLFSVKSDENNPENSIITITDEISGKSIPFVSVKIKIPAAVEK